MTTMDQSWKKKGYQNSRPGCREEVEIKDYINLQLEEGRNLRLHYLVGAPCLVPPTSYSQISLQHLGQGLFVSHAQIFVALTCISVTSKCWNSPGLEKGSLYLLSLPWLFHSFYQRYCQLETCMSSCYVISPLGGLKGISTLACPKLSSCCLCQTYFSHNLPKLCKLQFHSCSCSGPKFSFFPHSQSLIQALLSAYAEGLSTSHHLTATIPVQAATVTHVPEFSVRSLCFTFAHFVSILNIIARVILLKHKSDHVTIFAKKQINLKRHKTLY